MMRKRFAAWLRARAEQIHPDSWQDHWPGVVQEWTWTPRSANAADPQGSEFFVRIKLFNGEYYAGDVYPVIPAASEL